MERRRPDIPILKQAKTEYGRLQLRVAEYSF